MVKHGGWEGNRGSSIVLATRYKRLSHGNPFTSSMQKKREMIDHLVLRHSLLPSILVDNIQVCINFIRANRSNKLLLSFLRHSVYVNRISETSKTQMK